MIELFSESGSGEEFPDDRRFVRVVIPRSDFSAAAQRLGNPRAGLALLFTFTRQQMRALEGVSDFARLLEADGDKYYPELASGAELPPPPDGRIVRTLGVDPGTVGKLLVAQFDWQPAEAVGYEVTITTTASSADGQTPSKLPPTVAGSAASAV